MPDNWDQREFDAALRQIQRESTYANADLIESNGRTLIRSIVYNTPKSTGMGRAGWTAGWNALNMAGTPATRRAVAPKVIRGMLYLPGGDVEDDRNKAGESSIMFTNTAQVKILKGKWKGRTLSYLYIANARGKSAGFMARGLREATFKFGAQYQRLLRKHSV